MPSPLSRHRELIAGLQRLKAQKVQGTDIISFVQRFERTDPQQPEPLGCSTATISQLRNGKLRLSKGKEARWIAYIKRFFEEKNWDYSNLVLENPIDAPDGTPNPFEKEKETKNTRLPNEYCGLFVGYYIDVNNKMLCEAVFLIEPNGYTRGKSAEGYFYEGWFSLQFGNHLFVGNFGGQEGNDSLLSTSHRFSITCSTTGFKQHGFLDGSYSGKGERSDNPVGGRTRLYKENDYDTSTSDLYEVREPEMFSLRYPNILRNHKAAQHERIRDTLLMCLGKTDNSHQFGESTTFFEEIGMMPPVIDTHISRLKGSYMTFKVALDGKIICNMMRIFSRGFVEIKSAEDQKIRFMGRAYLNGSILHIFFFKKYFPPSAHGIKENFEPFYCYYNYKLGVSTERRESIKHIFGLSAHVTDNAGLRSGYEMLMPIQEDEEGEAYEGTESFKIDITKCSEVEKNNFLELYPPLIHFFEQSHKPFITEERTLNSHQKLIVPNEKGNTYFAAACYHFYNNNYEIGIKYMEQAKMAGFKEVNRLTKELQNGLLSQIAKEEQRAIKRIFDME
jgi:hypothetical protein